jgi:hypothetical protein
VPDRLGQSRGPRAEDQHHLVEVTGRRPGRRRVGVDGSVDRLRPVEVRDPALTQQTAQQFDAGTVGHSMDGSGELQSVAGLHRLPGRTEEHGRRADLADAVDRHHELRPVGRHHGHTVAGADATLDQVAAEGGAPLVEVAEGPLVVAGHHGCAFTELHRGLLQGVVHQGAGHRKHSSLS